MSAERVAILTAMVQELRPLVKALRLRPEEAGTTTIYRGAHEGIEIVAATTGIGTLSARQRTERVLNVQPVDHVLMVGIAGAVGPQLDIGALVVPEFVIDARTGSEYTPATSHGHEPRGGLLTSDELITDPGALETLTKRGIVAVDMETAAVASVCCDRDVAWSVLRAVSDRAGDVRTDDSVLGLSHPDGTAKPASVARYLASHPGRIPHLFRLARGMRGGNAHGRGIGSFLAGRPIAC